MILPNKNKIVWSGSLWDPPPAVDFGVTPAAGSATQNTEVGSCSAIVVLLCIFLMIHDLQQFSISFISHLNNFFGNISVQII